MNFIEGEDARQEGAHAIGIRPEHFDVVSEGGRWRGQVVASEHLGSDTFLRVKVEGVGLLMVRSSGEVAARYGDEIGLNPNGRIYRFDDQGNAQ